MSKFKTILILGLAMTLISIPAMAGKPYANFWLQVQDEHGAARTDFVSISVYDLDTTDLATIYASATGTSKTNPILLAATSSGTAFWYADASTFDVLVTFSDQTVLFEDFSVYDHRVMCLDKAKTITENFNKVTIASTEGTTLALTPGQVAGYGINMTTASQTLTGSFYGLQMHLVGLVHGSQRVTGIRMNMPVSTGLYDAVFQVTGRQTKGEIIDITTVQTLGEVLDVSFDTVTLAGAMTGINLDMSTNVTHGSQTMKGLVITMPSGSTSTGIEISADTATGIDCNSTTASSSTTTGSIHTDGGLGVAGKVFTGDHIYMTAGKHIYFRGSGDDYQSIWSISGGKLKIQTSGTGADDLIIDGTITQMDDITLQSGALIISDDTTEATGTTDGAIQTDGGVGIAKKLFVGGTSNFTGLLTAAGGIDTVGATTDITLKNDATIVNTSADLLTITEPTITLAGSTAINLDGPTTATGILTVDTGGSPADGIKISATTPTDGLEISSVCGTNAINISSTQTGSGLNIASAATGINMAGTYTTGAIKVDAAGDTASQTLMTIDSEYTKATDWHRNAEFKLRYKPTGNAGDSDLKSLSGIAFMGIGGTPVTGAGSVVGVHGLVHFYDGYEMTGSSNMVNCAMNAALASNGTPVFTAGHIAALHLQNNIAGASPNDTSGIATFIYFDNAGAGGNGHDGQFDSALYLNTYETPYFLDIKDTASGYLYDASAVSAETSSGRIKVRIAGADRYIYYYD